MPDNEWNRLLSCYENRLIGELRERSQDLAGYKADTVYFGGGTPSLITPISIERIIDTIDSVYGFSKHDSEITLECNPEDVSTECLRRFVASGINRIVLGVQSMDLDHRTFIGRSGSIFGRRLLEEFFSTEGFIRCIDLIIGIPGQSEQSLREELQLIALYRPEHISVYLLSIENNTPLGSRFREYENFQEDQRRAYLTAEEVLTGIGYTHYEISNYCLPGRISRHNMKYWKFMPYAGFGPGAHSFVGGERLINTCGIDEYISTGTIRLFKDEREGKSAIAEFFMTGMRLMEGVSGEEYEHIFGVTIPEGIMAAFESLQGKGYVNIGRDDGVRIRFTTRGILIMDALLQEVLEPYL